MNEHFLLRYKLWTFIELLINFKWHIMWGIHAHTTHDCRQKWSEKCECFVFDGKRVIYYFGRVAIRFR